MRLLHTMLRVGDMQRSINFYTKERDTWPESQVLMTSLIQNLERRQATQSGAKP